MKINILNLSLIILLLLFFNCKNKPRVINILTDDIALYEVVDCFNAAHENIKVSINYLNNKEINEKNIFKYVKVNRIVNYDMIIGNINPQIIIDSKYFCKIKKYSKQFKKNKSFFPLVNDYLMKYSGYAVPYSINFPVIIARKDSIPKDITNDEIDIQTFSEYATSINKNKKNKKIKLGFIPCVSEMSELDFFFIFNSYLIKKNNKYSFNTPNSQNAIEFYHKYDEKYNYGNDITEYYLKKYNNINKKFYLKQNIISFDFISISNALALSLELYKIFFINDLKLAGLNNKIVSILKTSIHKKESGIFIDYLFDYNTQLKLSEKTLKQNNYYSHRHIPVIKGLISNVQKFPIPVDKFEEYINKLEHIYFYNNKIQKIFFKKYFLTKKMINKELISEKDFLDYFSEQINKKK